MQRWVVVSKHLGVNFRIPYHGVSMYKSTNRQDRKRGRTEGGGGAGGCVRELHGLMSEIAGGSMCDSLFHLSPFPYIVSNL